ncbi:sugar phosphate nucleotidyltransferase [Sediminibacterium ginsengisoli]|uniref:Nucleotidyl transferase n=1 Tax=Sediminibacterium ginsengisoli TaxID=413434 RepID=A0A1T4QUU4_9BACT|nr:sugar phosphate nucleotidyltransferase [Sediminibacterium ginsengisoli]SKA07068.1 Nucleotidyl transferase [Sediminibacterium ginsengisoli]
MKPTLVILAAGMASRYGSMKQIESFGPAGETIMDYSIYDAIRAGFGKIVFIIREEFAEQFKSIFEPKLNGKIATDYVFQHLEDYTGGRTLPAERTKPWGTAHAVLCCKGKVNEPFAVINADDYYGRDAFVKAYDFLTTQCNEQTYCIIGYELKKTLSDNGTVSRGVCEVDADNNLTDINERTKIYRNDQGVITYEDEAGAHEVSEDSLVSMNYLCFAPGFIDLCEEQFNVFLDAHMNEPKAEFFIPTATKYFIQSGKGNVKVIPTTAQWFGVTYKEDAPSVQASINALVAEGEYPASLWA